MLGRGVHDHAAPAAADVEQPHPRLAARAWRRRGRAWRTAPPPASRPRGEDRAGVGHGRAEHPLVEACSRRRSGARWPGGRGPSSAAGPRGRYSCAGAGRRWRSHSGSATRASRSLSRPGRSSMAWGRRPERDVQVAVDLDLAGDVGPGQAERPRCAARAGRWPAGRRCATPPRRCPDRPCCRRNRAPEPVASGPTMLQMISATRITPSYLRVEVEQPTARVVALLERAVGRPVVETPELVASE